MGTILDVNMGGGSGGAKKKDSGILDQLNDFKVRCP